MKKMVILSGDLLNGRLIIKGKGPLDDYIDKSNSCLMKESNANGNEQSP